LIDDGSIRRAGACFWGERAKSSLSRLARARGSSTLGGGVLGDGLGTFRHGVLAQLSGEHQADGGLDFARRQGRLAVVANQAASFSGDALEDVVDERVHDRHGAAGDAGVGVDLLEHLVDVRRVGLDALLVLLLLVAGGLGGLLDGELALSFTRTLGRHVE